MMYRTAAGHVMPCTDVVDVNTNAMNRKISLRLADGTIVKVNDDQIGDYQMPSLMASIIAMCKTDCKGSHRTLMGSIENSKRK